MIRKIHNSFYREERSEKILRDLRKVNMRVDTLINEINHNIESTKKEIAERKEKRNKKNIGEVENE